MAAGDSTRPTASARRHAPRAIASACSSPGRRDSPMRGERLGRRRSWSDHDRRHARAAPHRSSGAAGIRRGARVDGRNGSARPRRHLHRMVVPRWRQRLDPGSAGLVAHELRRGLRLYSGRGVPDPPAVHDEQPVRDDRLRRRKQQPKPRHRRHVAGRAAGHEPRQRQAVVARRGAPDRTGRRDRGAPQRHADGAHRPAATRASPFPATRM